MTTEKIIDTGKPGEILAIRADIDALPLQADEFNLKQKKVAVSENDGACHACGHDGHCAMLISAAKIIVENKDDFCGDKYTWRSFLEYNS